MARLSDKLRPASFRGVPFQVEGSDVAAGRRVQVHEYPQRDKPWAEDLGRATRVFTVTGFLVGADYVDQANRLLAALEQSGPGSLVHPWLGTLQVSLKEPAQVAFSEALGHAKVAMHFVEGGELAFPAAATATGAAARQVAARLETSAVAAFARRFNVAGLQDFVSAAAGASLAGIIGRVGQGVPGLEAAGYANSMTATALEAVGLLGNPTALGWRMVGFLGLSGLATAGLRWASLAGALVDLATHEDLAAPAATASASGATPSRIHVATNDDAARALTRQVLLAQAVGASSLADTTVYDDVVGLRAGLTGALDAEALAAPDEVYPALVEARGAVFTDLTTRARDSARLTTRVLPEVTPALALAYDSYEDAARESEVATRNRARRPGFLAGAVRLLTR